ncbi:hypothetical protein [Micromonospora sp. L32]|uniref:hypothetical protein n=1 Tax=unclassified Micromonospora TaxID=2617518 RepID=UPI003F8B28BF
MDGGLTYERLARLGLHRWWMPPVALAAAVSVAAVTAPGEPHIGQQPDAGHPVVRDTAGVP